MNHRTSTRRFGVIGLAVALLSLAACSIDASNQPPPTAEGLRGNGRNLDIGHARDDTGSANDRGNRSGDSAHRRCRSNSFRSAMDVCTSDASAPAKRPSC